MRLPVEFPEGNPILQGELVQFKRLHHIFSFQVRVLIQDFFDRWATWPTITDTGIRIPLMQARPPIIFGSKVILSNMACLQCSCCQYRHLLSIEFKPNA
jgi:hypothetical protein